MRHAPWRLLALAMVAGPASIAAQSPDPATDLVARTYDIRARPGMEEPFARGYQRHLEWHVAAGDRSTWYFWDITDGERAGWSVDGTFNHRWEDFDRRVDPAGDSADNARNVEPFAERGANQTWRWRGVPGGESRHAIERAGLVYRVEYRTRNPDALLAALSKITPAPGAGVYQLVSGGAAGTFVLWVPLVSSQAAGQFLAASRAALAAAVAAAEWSRAETWRFRGDLSICHDPALRCHRTLNP